MGPISEILCFCQYQSLTYHISNIYAKYGQCLTIFYKVMAKNWFLAFFLNFKNRTLFDDHVLGRHENPPISRQTWWKPTIWGHIPVLHRVHPPLPGAWGWEKFHHKHAVVNATIDLLNINDINELVQVYYSSCDYVKFTPNILFPTLSNFTIVIQWHYLIYVTCSGTYNSCRIHRRIVYKIK